MLNKKEVLCQKFKQKLLYLENITSLTCHLKHCHEEEYALLCKAQTPLPTLKPKKKEQIIIQRASTLEKANGTSHVRMQ